MSSPFICNQCGTTYGRHTDCRHCGGITWTIEYARQQLAAVTAERDRYKAALEYVITICSEHMPNSGWMLHGTINHLHKKACAALSGEDAG